MADVNEVLRKYDAVEANLTKLEGLWERMVKLIPGGVVFGLETTPEGMEYADLTRSFRNILDRMPAIDGRRIRDLIQDLESIATNRFHAHEVGEPECFASVECHVYAQEKELRNYRWHFDAKRRAFVRERIEGTVAEVTDLLGRLASLVECDDDGQKVPEAEWEPLRTAVAQLEVLMGTSIARPPRWGDLKRHVAFGLICDLNDIVKHDWPAVHKGLEGSMYTGDEPIPVEVEDLSELSADSATGRVIASLHWSRLTPAEFERLIFAIFASTPGYENTDWLMHPNAPDQGRDVQTFRSHEDPLVGTRQTRIMIQCKHWLTKAVKPSDITALADQLQLWEPPTIGEIIIATSGRFSSDAVRLVEQRGQKGGVPHIRMWPDSHLESILAKRPDLVAEFNLRDVP